MKAISLLQPWASLVVLGHKSIETRSWNTKYRGPLLIHASAGKKPYAKELAKSEPFLKFLPKDVAGRLHFDGLPFGAIIGMVNVVDVMTTEAILKSRGHILSDYEHPELNTFKKVHQTFITAQELAFGDYSPDRYGWLLSDPVQFKEPIPAKGMQGFWKPDEATALLITQALAVSK